MSDGLIEAKRVYVALLIASFVLSTGNRKKMLRRVPSRANRIELALSSPIWHFAMIFHPAVQDRRYLALRHYEEQPERVLESDFVYITEELMMPYHQLPLIRDQQIYEKARYI